MPLSELHDQLIADTITTAVEGGTGYWAAVSEYEWDCPPFEAFAVLHETQDGDDTGDPLIIRSIWGEAYYKHDGVRLDHDTMKAAIQKIIDPDVELALHASNRGIVAAGWIDPEEADWDADVADWIAQVAVLGDVIYG